MGGAGDDGGIAAIVARAGGQGLMPTSVSFAAARRLRRLAWLLDSAIPLPGGRFRIGLDAVIGLVPGIGDLVGALLSGYIIAQAARLGAPRAVLLRMAINVAVEGVFGMVPVVGDLFDAGWKANQRNVELLRDFLQAPAATRRASAGFVFLLLAVLVVALTALGMLVWLLLRALFAAG